MMKRLLVAAAIAACAWPAFALPSIDAVQHEISQGHDARAGEMLREVIAARPDSARAHYVYAELLAHDARFAQAAEEAAQARRLDPTLSFTEPAKYKAFVQLLEREQGTGRHSALAPPAGTAPLHAMPSAPAGGGVPGWLWGAGAVLAAVALWRLLGARPAAPAAAAATYAPGAAYGGAVPAYGTGYAAAPAASGSGLLGTGLAVAGGMAAGVLAERLLEGHREAMPAFPAAPAGAGLVPGFFDADAGDDGRVAAQQLEERPIDFGNGDGWGGSSDTQLTDSNDGW